MDSNEETLVNITIEKKMTIKQVERQRKNGDSAVMAPVGRSPAAALTVALAAALVVAAGGLPACPLRAPPRAQLDLQCVLGGGTEVELSVRAGEYVALHCRRGADYSCGQLPRVGPPPAPPPSAGLRGCALPAGEPLACTLRALGAAGAAALTLRAVPGGAAAALRPDHTRGLPALAALTLVGAGEDEAPLPAAALAELPGLRRLTVREARLTLSPGALDGARALEYLEMSASGLRSVGGALRGLAALRTLSLWGNELSELPAGALRGLAALERLELSSNPLRALAPAALADAAELRELRLVDTALGALDEAALRGLARLDRLWVQQARAPLAVGARALSLPALRVVFLESCGLAALPGDALRGARSLATLSLADNALAALPGALLRDAAGLRALNLSGNALTALEPALFAPLRQLEDLNLDRNRLETFQEPRAQPAGAVYGGGGGGGEAEGGDAYAAQFGASSPLQALAGLRRLDLAANRVRAVCSDWRYVMLHLDTLNLTYNSFQTITEADINFLSMDVTVDFRYNNITTVELDDWTQPAAGEGGGEGEGGAPGAARLLLDGIPLRCDCHALGLQRRLRDERARPRLELSAACAAPPALANDSLRAVGPERLECPLAAPACPAGCECTLRPAARALELDCGEAPAAAAAPAPAALGLERTVLRLRRAPASLALPLVVHELLAALQRAPGRVRDWRRVTCAGGGPLWRVDAARLCAGAAAWAGGALAALGLAAGAAAAGWLRWRRELRVWLYARGWCGWLTRAGAGAEPAALYDAFVSFSHEDEALVAGSLVPALERRGYLVCVHYRDWAPGAAIAEQVARSVRAARRTLVVVSAGFLRSEWARAEFRAAHARALREGRARVIVVLLGEARPALPPDDELGAYLRTNTYVQWGDPWFWPKLQYALPHAPLGVSASEPDDEMEKGRVLTKKRGILSKAGLRAALAGAAPDKLAPALAPRMQPPPAPPPPPPLPRPRARSLTNSDDRPRKHLPAAKI
ncbi:hypothetical protein MSG28_007829 [Choristoneura fumiferana]|uniref:Uncharacterized protein n=1 Tax=Choristoneura fumiferana TaxID=7141 RepID=A0ACC0J8W7_CHOFU|nr:hypothetical protein MSG28_007829 [Choristoneura fumiferana]